MPVIDLRSDTVTLPTQAMLEAILHADLGDDVFAEDPTINRLEAMMAERIGMEAALLVASGTMGNATCMLTHCARGEEAILGDSSHIFLNEAGGMSALGGIFPHTIPNLPDGTMRLDQIEAGIIAAAGIVALEQMIERLAEDHANAHRLAEGISKIQGLATEPKCVRTNILYIDLVDKRFTDDEFMSLLKEKGVMLSHPGPSRFRMLTHHGIGAADIETAIEALSAVMRS